MRERLLLLGGTLEAGWRDGQWVVEADLPLAPAAKATGPRATTSVTGTPVSGKSSQ
jgi:hypothetical protein